MYRRVLIGFRDEPAGRDALALGQALTRACGAEMLVATAPSNDGRSLSEIARFEEADLVVVGSTSRGTVGRVVPGMTVDRLVAEGSYAVAVAPPGFCDRGRRDGWKPDLDDPDDLGLRVLGVGFDGTDASRDALWSAAEIALANGAALRVYSVVPKTLPSTTATTPGQPVGVPSNANRLRTSLHEAVAALPAEARALPVVLHGNPVYALLDAVEFGVDMLVIGSPPTGRVRRVVYTGITHTLAQEASCPILISPPHRLDSEAGDRRAVALSSE